MRDVLCAWGAGVLIGVAYLLALPLAFLLIVSPSAEHMAGACALEAGLVVATVACLERRIGGGTLLVVLALLAAGCVLAAPILRPVVGTVALLVGLAESAVLVGAGRFTLRAMTIVLSTVSIAVALLAG